MKRTAPARGGPVDNFAQFSAFEYAQRGYRRVSNRYRYISRIDRADWIEVLAKHLMLRPEDLFPPGAKTPQGNWADYYRRVLSKDVITVDAETYRFVPGSDWDDTGYVE